MLDKHLEKCDFQPRSPLLVDAKLKFSDVYTDSEQEESSCQIVKALSDNIIDVPSFNIVEDPGPSTSSGLKVKHGTFLLVQIETKAKVKKIYKYVAVAQGEIEDAEVKVMFLKSASGQDSNLFVMDDEDVAYISYIQILEILPEPDIKVMGNRIFYSFKCKLDLEK